MHLLDVLMDVMTNTCYIDNTTSVLGDDHVEQHPSGCVVNSFKTWTSIKTERRQLNIFECSKENKKGSNNLRLATDENKVER